MALVAVSTRLDQSMSPSFSGMVDLVRTAAGFGGEVLIWTEDTCGEERLSSLTGGMIFVASCAGLDVEEVFEMTVAGLAMWKLTSADTLSSNLAIFSLDRDFINDSSDSVFLGSFERGESWTDGWAGGGISSKSGLISFMRSSWSVDEARLAEFLADRDTFFLAGSLSTVLLTVLGEWPLDPVEVVLEGVVVPVATRRPPWRGR